MASIKISSISQHLLKINGDYLPSFHTKLTALTIVAHSYKVSNDKRNVTLRLLTIDIQNFIYVKYISGQITVKTYMRHFVYWVNVSHTLQKVWHDIFEPDFVYIWWDFFKVFDDLFKIVVILFQKSIKFQERQVPETKIQQLCI